MTQKVRPFLWFDDKAEEAANFYVSIFKDAKIVSGRDPGDDPEEPVMSVRFQIDGQEFIAFNGGPHFTFSPAISLFVNCETQAEVDELWEKLSAGGEKERCGWVKDKYGISWQIIPSLLGDLMNDPDEEKSGRVVQAMLQMQKIDIEGLKRAYAGA
jgi:predicted 3-demethylubiquinone-9 3-methyltransferase (glyoxalase superfamily)